MTCLEGTFKFENDLHLWQKVELNPPNTKGISYVDSHFVSRSELTRGGVGGCLGATVG